ncbi:hypothetical protein TL16_g02271 [Triparma laevis f. inornata]|uniref:Uncharacterized protein n=1 Tax=Triparma laevis f. inornata TaxID=1714386 RepID=A0A9W6ZTW2_9STRA|nr:hypothetical protein TL16_g02271 [Triparma laevis f. inornata]
MSGWVEEFIKGVGGGGTTVKDLGRVGKWDKWPEEEVEQEDAEEEGAKEEDTTAGLVISMAVRLQGQIGNEIQILRVVENLKDWGAQLGVTFDVKFGHISGTRRRQIANEIRDCFDYFSGVDLGELSQAELQKGDNDILIGEREKRFQGQQLKEIIEHLKGSGGRIIVQRGVRIGLDGSIYFGDAESNIVSAESKASILDSIQRMQNVTGKMFKMNKAKCCAENYHPEKDEKVLHLRGFETEISRARSMGFHDLNEKNVVEFVGRGDTVIGDKVVIVKPSFVNATGIIMALKSGGVEVRVAEVPKGSPSTSDLCFMMKADHLMGNSLSTFVQEAIFLGDSTSSTLYAVGKEAKTESWERGENLIAAVQSVFTDPKMGSRFRGVRLAPISSPDQGGGQEEDYDEESQPLTPSAGVYSGQFNQIKQMSTRFDYAVGGDDDDSYLKLSDFQYAQWLAWGAGLSPDNSKFTKYMF